MRYMVPCCVQRGQLSASGHGGAIPCLVDAAGVPERERLFTRGFIQLSLADLAYFTSFGVAIHALPLYVTGPLGGDAASAGLAFGAFGITALICRPFAGRLADRRGRRPLLGLGADRKSTRLKS